MVVSTMMSSRLLILLFAMMALVSAMGHFVEESSENDPPSENCGDWPEEFPDAPDGFKFDCKNSCVCRCRHSTASPSSTHAPSSTVAPTAAPTSSAAPSTTTVKPSSTAVPTSSAAPSTQAPTTPPPPTAPYVSTVAATHSSPPTPSVGPSSSSPTPTPPVLEQDEGKKQGGNRVFAGGQLEGDEEEETTGSSGTTFWIRTPTPPNLPNLIGGFGLTFPTPKIQSPFAPEQALKPLDANLPDSNGFDFNIATVGTPKAPRAPIDPDA